MYSYTGYNTAILSQAGGDLRDMNRIKQLRELFKITQVALSEKAQISQPYLCDLENNRRGAKPETMQRIADALGVSVQELTDKKAG